MHSMIIRNGIMSNLRERGRTALFSLLIVFLTVTMILSVSVLLYCNAAMNACDEAYRSIALVEYMGSEYPNEDEPDPAARAAAEALTDESVLAVPGVTAWTRGSTAFGFAEGYERRFGTMPYGTRAVIVVDHVSEPVYQWRAFNETDNSPIASEGSFSYYRCSLRSIIYSRKGKEENHIDLLPDNSGFVPEEGKSYILNGWFVDVSGSARAIGDYPMNGFEIFRIDSFFSSDDLPYAEYTPGEDIPEVFLNAAEQYRVMNNYVRVVPCHDVNDVYAFQQNELQLTEGGMPDPGASGACVITSDLANALELSPGDKFTMDELRGTAEDRYRLMPSGDIRELTVSGIANMTADWRGTAWVIAENADAPLFGYLLGTASLRNGQGEEAAEALQALAAEGVRVTLLDQGYGNAVQPLQEVRKTAVDVLLVCSAGVIAVLLLFAFLFVGRQGDTVKIMVSMGTPGRKISLWFLSGALVICGASAILGTALGTVLRPRMFDIIAGIIAAARAGEGPLWYSETALGVAKETNFNPQVPSWPGLLAALGIVVTALLFCLLFLRLARRGGTRKRGKSRVRVPRGKTSVRHRGGLRFALLSIRRGGLRSLVVPLVSFAMTVAVIVLGSVYQGWQNELDNALENTRIDGQVVSLNGRYYSGMALSVDDIRMLLGVEGVDGVSVSNGYHYWLEEDVPSFSHGNKGRARRLGWIGMQPEMVALNSLAAASEFYYADPAVTWLDGWDETMLKDPDHWPMVLRLPDYPEEKRIPAVCSTGFLEAHGIALGDEVECMVMFDYGEYFMKEIPVYLQVVGSYARQEGKANIYVPLSCYIPPDMLEGAEAPKAVGQYFLFSFRTCRFFVSSARDLETVRERLREHGFSAVGRISANRMTLLLRDAAFLKLKENMERNITMGRVMSTVLSMLIILLGFIISWLMTYSRRREFALMRGFGAKKRRVFASFFFEQAMLSFTGCLAGCAALFGLYAGGITQPLAVAAYLACYLLGTAVSILMIGKTDLMELLTVRD